MRRILQIGFAHDVVSIEHGSGLVPTHSHCDPLRYPGTNQVSDAGSPQVVEKPGWLAGLWITHPQTHLFASDFPRPSKVQDAFTLPREDIRTLRVLLIPHKPLRLEELTEGRCEWNDARIVVLRRAWIEPDDALAEINLVPTQPKNLSSTTSCVVRECQYRLDLRWKYLAELLELLMLEESLPDVVLLQHRDVRDSMDLRRSMLAAEVERPLENGQLSVDRRIGRIGGQTLRNVLLDRRCRELHHRHGAERWPQMKPHLRLCPAVVLLIDLIVRQNVIEQLADERSKSADFGPSQVATPQLLVKVRFRILLGAMDCLAAVDPLPGPVSSREDPDKPRPLASRNDLTSHEGIRPHSAEFWHTE